MSKAKTIKLLKVTIPDDTERNSRKLPYNTETTTRNDRFVFSFSHFDRTHELFNLGDNNSERSVKGSWFISLLDCLKEVSTLSIPNLRGGKHDLHPIDWKKTNAKNPINADQQEYWQFRLNKSHGRVIGFKIDNVFYVVWLDPHHNLTDSEGYGTVAKHKPGLSDYDLLLKENQCLKDRLQAD